MEPISRKELEEMVKSRLNEIWWETVAPIYDLRKQAEEEAAQAEDIQEKQRAEEDELRQLAQRVTDIINKCVGEIISEVSQVVNKYIPTAETRASLADVWQELSNIVSRLSVAGDPEARLGFLIEIAKFLLSRLKS